MKERNSEFRNALAALINRNSMENGSDTPDFILARYLVDCLEVFDRAVIAREKWYDRDEEMGRREALVGDAAHPPGS
jgi:hypothetical protein